MTTPAAPSRCIAIWSLAPPLTHFARTGRAGIDIVPPHNRPARIRRAAAHRFQGLAGRAAGDDLKKLTACRAIEKKLTTSIPLLQLAELDHTRHQIGEEVGLPSRDGWVAQPRH